MTLRTYEVRHHVSPEDEWVVEIEERRVFASSSQVDAIAAALDAARAAAGDGVEARVVLEHEAGFSYTLSRFRERTLFPARLRFAF